MSAVKISEIAGWLAVLLLAMIVAVFLWRKLYRRFPLFFGYVVLTELVTVVRFVAFRVSQQLHSDRLYYYAYWTSDVVLTVFAFLALYELFIGNLFARFHKVRVYRFLFPLAAILMLGFTGVAALYAPKGSVFPVAARTYDLLRALVLMFFGLLVLFMGREWKRHEFAIALGFGIYASALSAYAAYSTKKHYGPTPRAYALLSIAYAVVCLIWLVGFWGSEKLEPNSEGMADPELLNEAKKWEGALKGWLSPTKKRQ
ncbi:MAG TPA: hypothetical protein VG649_11235 [Candidatus Angelobacter sp.]|jgi:hypothetical protein|nr:hypothetical protein [Candidatus Angelobacter sp.]